MQIEKAFYNQFLKRWNEGYFQFVEAGAAFIWYADWYGKKEAKSWPVEKILTTKELSKFIAKNFQLV